MLEAGIKGQHTIIVEKENTAAVMKSGTLAVFATYWKYSEHHACLH